MPDLSIILPTCNRAPLLERSLSCIWAFTECDYEVIVVDGASEDATPRVLDNARLWMGDRLKVIREEQREGFVRAANKGFKAASGRHMMWLNDDARPTKGSLDRAVAILDSGRDGIGLLAAYHRCDVEKNVAYESEHRGQTYRLLHVRGTLYANFGIAPRELFERLGYFDERYYLNAADPDFSLKVWHSGSRVTPGVGVLIDHSEQPDDRRALDSERGRADNEALFAKWDLPAKNLAFNDFDPNLPCTLRGLREAQTPMAEAA